MIIAVDFDGTLCEEDWPDIGPAHKLVINTLIELQKKGNKLILWTCRNGKLLNDAVNWCKDQGLIFDAVNENLPEVLEAYGGNDSRKITADYYLDDKAIGMSELSYLKHIQDQRRIKE